MLNVGRCAPRSREAVDRIVLRCKG